MVAVALAGACVDVGAGPVVTAPPVVVPEQAASKRANTINIRKRRDFT
jgi:hypothetical protein